MSLALVSLTFLFIRQHFVADDDTQEPKGTRSCLLPHLACDSEEFGGERRNVRGTKTLGQRVTRHHVTCDTWARRYNRGPLVGVSRLEERRR